MSTILRALQKIEKDTTEETERPGSPLHVHPVNASNTISKRLTALWYLQLGKRFLWIGSGLACTALVVYLSLNIFGGNDRSNSSAGTSHSREYALNAPLSHTVPPSQSQSSDSAMQKQRPTRPQDYAPKPSYDPNHQPGRNTGKSSRSTASLEKVYTPQDRTEPPLETEIITPGDADEDNYYDEPEEPEEPETPIEILESDPEELRYAQLDILENGKLELQAISWAKTPSQRIAVINDEIMHQGQIVGGYKIVYIGPEQVAVEKGGRQWKIIFMVR